MNLLDEFSQMLVNNQNKNKEKPQKNNENKDRKNDIGNKKKELNKNKGIKN